MCGKTCWVPRNLILSVVGLWLALALRGAEAPRVALLDFERQGAAGSLEPELADLSRAVQAKLFSDAGFAWIERQEFERLTQEMALQRRSSSPASAVQLGQLLRADLVLRGEITAEGERGELSIEVIDLKRADLLARRTVALTLGRGRRLAPTPAEIDQAFAAAHAALGEGRAALETTARLRVIAPLYFKNISRTDRLNFVEERLAAAVEQTAGPANGFRLLTFPQATAASGESALVLGGLTETNPDAWQQVADAYVWATVEEKGAAGDVFEDVPVAISLLVWDGFGAPVEKKWEGTVRDLDHGITTVVTAGLLGLKPVPAGAVRDAAERDRLAAEMFKRARDMAGRLQDSQFQQYAVARGVSAEDFARSSEGQRIKTYERRLLEIAAFLKPLDTSLRQNVRNILNISEYAGRVGPATLSGAWPRVRALQTRWDAAVRPGGQPPDAELAKNLMKAIEELHDAVLTQPARWYHQGPELTTAERREQIRQMSALWLNNLIDVNRVFAGSPAPAWLEKVNGRQIDILQRQVMHLDVLRARALLERSWPVLRFAAGQVLRRPPSNTVVDSSDRLIETVFSVYYAFGDNDRAIALLDEAWRSAAPVEPEPVTQVTYGVNYTIPGGSIAPVPADVAFPANVREIEPWPKVFLRGEIMAQTAPLQKTPARIVDAMAWHQGRLWIAESARIPLAPEFGLKNPEGDHFLWSYDPALRHAEFATARLESHTTVRSLLSQGDDLWLGFDGAGLWRWNPDSGQIRRFKGEDGLLSMRIQQAQAQPEVLTFLGVGQQKPVLLRHDLTTGSWGGLETVPDGGSALRSRCMAVFGPWLVYADGEPRFYNFQTKEWKRMLRPLPIKPGERMSEVPRFYPSVISADDKGFWFGRENLLRFMDPNAPEKQTDIEIRGYPVALAHSGPWLWVLLEDKAPPSLSSYEPEDKITPSRLVLVDKRSLASVGTLMLPAKNMRHLLVADNRVWVGGSTILEVDPVLPDQPLTNGPAPSALKTQPLHHAAARGDRAAIEAAIQAKEDLNASAPNGWTPLMSAAAGNRLEIVQRLLAGGADPQREAVDGTTALLLAVDRANPSLVKILLAAGAKAEPVKPSALLPGSHQAPFPKVLPPEGLPPPPKMTQAELVKSWSTPSREAIDWGRLPGWPAEPALILYRTPLIAAVEHDSAELVDLLVEGGANPNYPDRCGRTALQLAVRHRKDAAARALLAHGANPALADAAEETPVLTAYLRQDNEKLLRELIAAVPAAQRRAVVSQPLYLAAASGRLEDLILLHSLGGDINARLVRESVLSAAVGRNQQAVIDWLLLNGVKVESMREEILDELLDVIMRRNDVLSLDKLLAGGLNVNAEIYRTTLLVRAVEKDRPALVALLKARGADLTRKNSGKLPIDLAKSAKVRAILSAASEEPGWIGPRTDSYQRGPTKQYRTRVTSGRPDDPGVVLPEAEIPAADQQLLRACAAGNQDLAQQAVAAGAHLDCRDEEGMTPLTHALEQKAPALVRWLVGQGAAVDFYTKMANFPLTFAVNSGLTEMVEFLLESGANPNTDGVGITPLMAAARSRNRSLAEKLLAAGADANLCGGGERSLRMNPLAEALNAGDTAMVELLLAHGASPRARFELYRRIDRTVDPKRSAPSLLMFAAGGGSVELLQRMIGLGQDPKYQTLDGYDALSWAAREGRKDAVKYLLPLSLQEGRAIDMALDKGHEDIAKALVSAGYRPR